MAVTKCKNGHWYDPNVYRKCPHCERERDRLSLLVDNVEEDDKTVSILDADISLGEQLGALVSGSAANFVRPDEVAVPEGDDDQTISFGFFGFASVSPVVGWLVCLTGDERGKDFRLKSGKNFIGRSNSMDVVLVDDKSISRDKHGCVIYDPKGNAFYAAPGAGAAVYLNNELLQETVRLKSEDIIKLGETELIFIPFCKEGRVWTEEE